MDLVVVIAIGLGIGVMVELLLPGHTIAELFLAVVLGIAGALVSRYIGAIAQWYGPGDPASFVYACLGATLVLLMHGSLFRRSRRSSRD
jgi:uncharacterized membrane protein YeaQ/YmgE (transglycosylase-associated protein family)